MKRFLIVLLFLILPFFSHPILIFAQSAVSSSDSATATSSTTTSSNESIWSKIWNWITSIFIKTDYTIAQRPTAEIISNMNNYGSIGDSNPSSSATRLSTEANQICYKGNVIKKVMLKTSGYPDTEISHICLNSSNQCSVSTDSSCQTIKISDLAHYFVQTNQQFYCDEKNILIDTESDTIDKVNAKFSDSIPNYEFDCFQAIYNDFYLVPKDTSDENEENSKNIVKTPIPVNEQNTDTDVQANKKQLDQNLCPEGSSNCSLNGLRPASW